MDAAGNTGQGFRQVLITCPRNETICWEDDAARPNTCSLNGRCVDESVSAALGKADVQRMSSIQACPQARCTCDATSTVIVPALASLALWECMYCK